MSQLKHVRVLIDDAIAETTKALEFHAGQRDKMLEGIANWLHESVPIAQDEVRRIFF